MEPPLNNTKFNLDVSGIVGFLGGGEAISAMESMHFYKYRKWLSWYNSPGSYDIAKHYGRLARSRIWDGIYPGPNEEPAELLGLDGEQGPPYRGVVSGTTLNDTGHVGYVFAQYCRNAKANPSQYSSDPIFTTQTTDDQGPKPQQRKRKTKVMNVVVVDFDNVEDNDDSVEKGSHLTLDSKEFPFWSVAVASIPISLNIANCILCGFYTEWYAFGVILYGILCNGIACYFIGSTEIYLTHTIPSPHSPPGNGILACKSDTLIVCRGSERAINHVVKAKFVVRYGKEGDDQTYHMIGFSAMSLTIQFIAQLFLIPLSGLFGQIMFLSTLAISWIYNAYLSSIDKGRLQQQLLERHLFGDDSNNMTKLELPTRTSAVVFAMLCGLPDLRGDPDANVECAKGIMCHLLPTDTKVWGRWHYSVCSKVRDLSERHSSGSVRPTSEPFRFTEDACQGFDGKDKSLLCDLLEDARGGYESYCQFLDSARYTPNSNSQSGSGSSLLHTYV
ncbi:hypothetical protein PLEOSDRAFT_1099590 [Pleurotus ostreatus PC15]|uniref:Uncharacterized protein n=1 Tax=Pleurotus ostreatus (strain PC15) TaxID=1137138 RepID=A0A067PB29_PLEO1|nr:hypothetical protein PLEOSDRAFT_1099590 [Pleurotus ostreatus PC15]